MIKKKQRFGGVVNKKKILNYTNLKIHYKKIFTTSFCWLQLQFKHIISIDTRIKNQFKTIIVRTIVNILHHFFSFNFL
jgi:hypothetical protein